MPVDQLKNNRSKNCLSFAPPVRRLESRTNQTKSSKFDDATTAAATANATITTTTTARATKATTTTNVANAIRCQANFT